MKPSSLPRTLLVLGFLLLAAGFSLLPYLLTGIPTFPGSNAAAQRAMQTVQTLSRSPRSPASPYHAEMRNFLHDELVRLGFQVEYQNNIQKTPQLTLLPTLINIIARMPGTRANAPIVLLVAHYDSMEGVPGAADNASGVAVVLEIARALRQEGPFANDMMILLTDGEEQGMLGAELFVNQYTELKRIKVVLNFDTLTLGPVMLWQTSPQNGWFLNRYFVSTPQPAGVSWIDAVTRLMPIGTDFDPFRASGITGGSFTTPYLPVAEHTSLDLPNLTTLPSLKHGILQGTGFTCSLLNADLAKTVAPDQVYLNLWGPLMITYPVWAAQVLGVFTVLLWGILAALAVRRKAVVWKDSFQGALFTIIGILMGVLIQVLIELIVFVKVPMLPLGIKNPLSIVMVSLPLSLLFYRRQKAGDLRGWLLGAQALWVVLVITSSFGSPFISPQLTFPLFFSLVPWLVELAPPWPVRVQRWLILAGLVGMGLFCVPVVHLLYMISGVILIPAILGGAVWSLLLSLTLPIYKTLPACVFEVSGSFIEKG